jgi:hypothetical protein
MAEHNPRKALREAVKSMERQSPLDAIRAKCMDCCGEMQAEVAACNIKSCSLWPYRFATNPHRANNMSDEQRARLQERGRMLGSRRVRQKSFDGQNVNPASPVSMVIGNKTYIITAGQKIAMQIAAKGDLHEWEQLHGKTRNCAVRDGFVTIDNGVLALTPRGQQIVATL